MKRIPVCCVLLVLALALALPASAAGRLQIVREDLHQLPYYDKTVTCHYFAELTNSGDKPVEFTRGLLELYDADGNSIDSSEITSCYPKVLQPGENAFIGLYRNIDTSQYTVADKMLSMMQQGKLTQNVVRLESKAREEKVDDGYSVRDYLVSEIKNSTEKPVGNFEAAFIVRGAENSILYIAYYSWRSYDMGIMPGSSVEVRIQVDGNFVNFWTANGLAPSSVETLVYIAAGV